jgi:hypothetical protein
MAEGKQSRGRLRRWLDKRRDAQRRGAEITASPLHPAARQLYPTASERSGSDSRRDAGL